MASLVSVHGYHGAIIGMQWSLLALIHIFSNPLFTHPIACTQCDTTGFGQYQLAKMSINWMIRVLGKVVGYAWKARTIQRLDPGCNLH
jgi:hypothetical protein